jgi:hypothetical protein
VVARPNVVRVPHEQAPAYMSLFDVAPFPRLPLPVCEMISQIKPFESMATGKAVVVSSVAALTEIVQADLGHQRARVELDRRHRGLDVPGDPRLTFARPVAASAP